MSSAVNLDVLHANGWITTDNRCKDVASKGHKKGLSRLVAAVFIFGEMAGSGILALPHAVKGTGWSGLAVIVICCVISAMSAVFLGKCWNIIEERWPEYRIIQAEPYGIIGLKAFGKKTQLLLSWMVSIQLYGVAIVFLTICADLFVGVLRSLDISSSLTTCELVIIVGVLIIPLTWLSSPAEMSWIAYAAMGCTAVSCVLLIIIYCQELVHLDVIAAPSPTVTFKSYFLSLGTIAFVYGGAATFPTFQNYMKDKRQFSHSVYIAFSGMLLLYILIAVGGFLLFGDAVERNVLENLPHSNFKTIIGILMAFHVSAALLIVINPVNIALEEAIRMKGKHQLLAKCILRSLVGLSMICIALTIPKFDKIMNLVGGTTASTICFMFPPIFYLRLIRQPNWPERKVSIWTKITCITIAVLGFVGGIVASYSAVTDIFNAGSFAKPCFIL